MRHHYFLRKRSPQGKLDDDGKSCFGCKYVQIGRKKSYTGAEKKQRRWRGQRRESARQLRVHLRSLLKSQSRLFPISKIISFIRARSDYRSISLCQHICWSQLVVAGSFPEVLLGRMKKAGDMDIWFTREISKLPSFLITLLMEAHCIVDGPDYAEDFISLTWRDNSLNAILVNIKPAVPLGQQIIEQFPHAVTRTVLEYNKYLRCFVLFEQSVTGKTGNFDRCSDSSKTPDYAFKHEFNLIEGVVRPNSLFDLCYLALKDFMTHC